MLKDIVPFSRVWAEMRSSSRSSAAIASFVQFIEQRLGAAFVYDQAYTGYESLDLVPLLELAETLKSHGIIRSYDRGPALPDEPRIAYWRAEYAKGDGKYERSGGNTLDNQALALTKALAEAVERHIWFTSDTFAPLRVATLFDMGKNAAFLHPNRFAGFSAEQRTQNPRLPISSTDTFTWVKGHSWTQNKPVWVPAQTVSGHKKLQAFSPSSGEPAIRASITTGLATHPDRTQAILSGALEAIERDAYIITWFNQIAAPRVDVDALSKKSSSLTRLLQLCRRYRFEPHLMRLPTDAPAYVMCAVLEDSSGSLPRFSVGLKANGNPADAAEGALFEALRMHQVTRQQMVAPNSTWDPSRKAADIKQYDRHLYYTEKERSEKLAFLITGPVSPLREEAWEKDSAEEHVARIADWCKKKGYEFASVSLASSAANVPGWSIEFVVIPELQPLHYNERLPHLGGKRLHDIPRQFGYKPRKQPYLDDPHPFA